MFTQVLSRVALGSKLVGVLTWPRSIDRYTELITPAWTPGEARARVVAVQRSTPRSVTLTLQPNAAFPGLRAGQHLNLAVDIAGRRRTRCYSPANAEGARLIELTVGLHDGGLVSTHLHRHARPGMVVGLTGVAGDFVLPSVRPQRILLVSGGSGITPVLSMLRTLRAEGHTARGGEIAFVHYARTPSEACYRGELATMPEVRVLHGFTRAHQSGDLAGHFGAEHLQAAMPDADAVYVCGPPALVAAVRELRPDANAETFVPPVFIPASDPAGGRVSFLGSDIAVIDDGRPLLDQAESVGLEPASGCRMGLCKTCTCRKTGGTVRNLITGELSTAGDEDIQICVSVPVGNVQLAL